VIAISVVLPTHDRASLLAKHLLQLKEQSLPVEEFEVIVVADGCTDDTAAIISGLNVPYRLTVLQQNPGAGASAARNRGAALALGDVVLFLDDDMEPRRDLLQAHLAAHGKRAGGVVLGYYPMQPPQKGESVFTKVDRLWWAEKFSHLALSNHRFTFKDFCTGNVSVAKSAFNEAGGFDDAIGGAGAGEDYELGYRLIKNRVPFQYVPAAESVHHSTSSWDASLRRATEEGYGHAIIARKHPEVFHEFNIARLSRLSESMLLRPVWIALWKFPALAEPPATALLLVARILLAMDVQSLFWKLQGILRGHAYWKGVRVALRSLPNWERLAQDAPYKPENFHEVDLDVSRDLIALDDFIREHWPVEAIRVFVSGQAVGRIPPLAGVEALSAQHVRACLVERFGSALLGELVTRKSHFSSPAAVTPSKPVEHKKEVDDSACQSISGEPRFPR
jgi:GT2 family glycosyltransferase